MSSSRGEAEQMFNLLDYDGSGEPSRIASTLEQPEQGNSGVLVEC